MLITNLNSNMSRVPPVKQSNAKQTPIVPNPPRVVAFDAKNYVKGHVTIKDVEFAK